MRIRGNGMRLSLPERIELEKRQRDYQALVLDFTDEVIALLGGIEGSARVRRKARQELAGAIADSIARFIVSHTDFE